MLDERPLQRVQALAVGKPLDGDDLGVLVRDGEREAAIHAPAIEQDGTGTALPMVAALLGTGESETFAQRVQERRPDIDEKPVRCPVHAEGDLKFSFVPLHEYTPLYLLLCLWTAGADPHNESVGYCRALIRQRVVSLCFALFQASNLLLQRGHVLLQFLHALLQGMLVLFKHDTAFGERSRTLPA